MKLVGEDFMYIGGARQLKNGEVVQVGTGPPFVSSFLAKLTHAPDMIMFLGSGVLDPGLGRALGGSDIKLLNECTCITGYREFYELLQAGYVDVGFVGAAQMDKYGNINTVVIGDYQRPKVRLIGAGGGSDIATLAKKTLVALRHEPRRFVEKLDFLSSPGYLNGPGAREKAGIKRGGPYKVVTDLGILCFDEETKMMKLESVHPGVSVEDVRRNTGFELIIPHRPQEQEPPTKEEIKCLEKIYKILEIK